MIHGHDSLYYRDIEEGSHKWQGLRSRVSDEQQDKTAEVLRQKSCFRRILVEILFLPLCLDSFETITVLGC